ncbi:hypothetical protein OROGR_024387 [Orobanche gracilis]
MVIAQYFEGVNLKLVKEQILFSIVVDFEGFLESNMTNQMERLIRNFKKNGVFNFLNISLAHLYKEYVICFYKEAEVGEYQITSNIFGQPILIDIHTIARAFDMEVKSEKCSKLHNPAMNPPKVTRFLGRVFHNSQNGRNFGSIQHGSQPVLSRPCPRSFLQKMQMDQIFPKNKRFTTRSISSVFCPGLTPAKHINFFNNSKLVISFYIILYNS